MNGNSRSDRSNEYGIRDLQRGGYSLWGQHQYLAGIYKMDDSLVAILDVERILKPEGAT